MSYSCSNSTLLCSMTLHIISWPFTLVKFLFSKKATKIENIFTIFLKLCSKSQIDSEDFVNSCGLLRKHELFYFACQKQLLLVGFISALSFIIELWWSFWNAIHTQLKLDVSAVLWIFMLFLYLLFLPLPGEYLYYYVSLWNNL